MKPILSLILPVYKVEAYVGACLDSILTALGQVEADESFEVICVDDGSPDRCGEILESYRERFAALARADRVTYTVIHQPNAGVSAARNAGLEAAMGEWLWFIDSDDSITSFSLSCLVRALREHPVDVFRFGYQSVETQDASASFVQHPVQVYDLTNATEVCQADRQGGLIGLLWNVCFRRVTIGELRFQLNMQPCEDTLFTLQVIVRAEALAVMNTIFYNYLQRPGSCMAVVSLGRVRSELEEIPLQVETLANWTHGHLAFPKKFLFKWARTMMCRILEYLPKLPSEGRRQIRQRHYEIGVDVFEGHPFYQMVFRSRNAVLVFLLFYLPWKIRMSLLRIPLILWLRNKVKGH